MTVKETYSLDNRKWHAYSARGRRKRFLGIWGGPGEEFKQGERVGEI